MDLLATLNARLDQMGQRLDREVQSRQVAFIEELLRWNRRINLTAITDPAEAIEKHLIDSLTLLPLLSGAESLLDLGSGGGFPGIPCKLALPDLRVVSVDAVQKKITFQRHVARLLGMEGFEAIHARAEELPALFGFGEKFDLIVSRAFSSLPLFIELALPCLAKRGRIVAMKGPEGEEERRKAEPSFLEKGLHCTDMRRLRLPVSRAERTLIVLQRE